MRSRAYIIGLILLSWQSKGHSCPSFDLTFNPNLAAIHFDQFFAQNKSQPGPMLTSRSLAFEFLVNSKQPGKILKADPNPGISHYDSDEAICHAGRNRHLSP